MTSLASFPYEGLSVSITPEIHLFQSLILFSSFYTLCHIDEGKIR